MRAVKAALVAMAGALLAACASTALPPPAIPLPELCVIEPNLFEAGAARDAALADMTAETRARFVSPLTACLEDSDPKVRDGYAYELISAILRGGNVPPETLRALKAGLLSRLADADGDPDGFRGPFAMLALAEVARTDRIEAWMSEDERTDLINAAHAYLAGLTDYRGFSDTDGWRHGVAHTADLLMQLSLNPALTEAQAGEILAAVAEKAGPADHAYVFGESERLAAPVLYLAQKGFLTPDDWQAWFGALWPADDPLREVAYSSEAALTKLHNLRAFSEAVYVSTAASGAPAFEGLGAAALMMLKSLP